MTQELDPVLSAEERATRLTSEEGGLVELIHLKGLCHSSDHTTSSRAPSGGLVSRTSTRKSHALYRFAVGLSKRFLGLGNST